MSIREVAEGRQEMGANEKVTYTITTTNFASGPASSSMTVKDSNGTDVSSTVATGSVSQTDDVITLKAISGLVAGESYRVDVLFTAGSGAPWSCYLWIDCEE